MPEKQLSGEVYYPKQQVIDHAIAKCEALYEFARKEIET